MNWLDVPIINAFRFAATVAFSLSISLSIVSTALAHHGGGTFDNTKTIELKGKLTRLELINPHSWIYFDAAGPDGKVRAYRCEMRSATVLRRSGWKESMFTPGQTITIEGQPDRKDPNSCYLNTIVLQDGSRTDRYGQFSKAPVTTKREPRRPSGEPNISGDWAPEQLVMTDPRGRGGALVPLITVGQYQTGRRTDRRAAGAGRPRPRRSDRHPRRRADRARRESRRELRHVRSEGQPADALRDDERDLRLDVRRPGEPDHAEPGPDRPAVRAARLHADHPHEPDHASRERQAHSCGALDRPLGRRRARRGHGRLRARRALAARSSTATSCTSSSGSRSTRQRWS